MTTDEAKAALEADAKMRTEACSKELKELLEKHRCTLDVAAVLKGGKAPDFVVTVVSQ